MLRQSLTRASGTLHSRLAGGDPWLDIGMENDASEGGQLSEDEINRLWQHGLHEERLFHDRLNYFSVVELGLLSAFAILYNKERPVGLLILITVAALVFTIFWLILQFNHWRYCAYLHDRMRMWIPEYRATVDEYFGLRGAKEANAFSFAKPLALAAPALLALTWVGFLAWVVITSIG